MKWLLLAATLMVVPLAALLAWADAQPRPAARLPRLITSGQPALPAPAFPVIGAPPAVAEK